MLIHLSKRCQYEYLPLRILFHTISAMVETLPQLDRTPEIITPQKELIIARDRGPCVGVNMALDITTEILDLVDGRESVYANHDPVHNDPILEEYKERGLVIEPEVQNVPPGSIFIFSAHGARPSLVTEAINRNLIPINVECTFVTKDRRYIGKAIQEGYYIIFLGSKTEDKETGKKNWHPEPIATLGDFDHSFFSLINIKSDTEIDETDVEEDDDKVEDIPLDKPIKVFNQTTLSTIQVVKRTKEISALLGVPLPLPEGICYATDNRQTSLREDVFGDSDKNPDKLIVIGSKTSNNTKELAEIGHGFINKENTYQIDTAEELQDQWFKEVTRVGLTSGASVLERFTEPVIEWFRKRGYEIKLEPSREKNASLRGPDLSELKTHLKQKYPETN